MNIETIDNQKKIAIYGSILSLALITISIISDKKMMAYGISFGAVLNISNYACVAAIFRLLQRFKDIAAAKSILFTLYQFRFMILVIILFAVIPHTILDFTVGAFLGLLAAKIGMGILIIKSYDKEAELNWRFKK